MAESTYRRTKIVCTLGPSTDRPGMLEKLIGAGPDVARLNAAHGDSDQHRRRVRHLRQVAARLGKSVALLMDLPGPKYRLGKLRASSQTLQQGHDISLGSSAAGEDVLPLADSRLLKDLRVGDPVFLADGTVQLVVSRVLPGRARCRVEIGGVVRSGSGLNLPTSRLSVRLPTEEDLPWIDFAVTEKIEWLGISFVRGAEDVENVRRHLGRGDERPHLIAKIEKREALAHLEAVVHAADGVMVARGDLGVETPLESVPMAQKRIIAEANLQGKPVITATQMLESMVEHSSPTRAEVTDVANAILDGTDAVMLSAETAIGAHGVEAVRTLDAVSRATEAQFPYGALLKKFSQIPWASLADAISLAVTRLSFDLKAAAIGVACDAEASAFRIARFRPETPIIVFCYRPADRGRFQLICNVRPVLVKPEDAFKPAALRKVLAELKVAAGPDKVVILVGADRQAAMESDFIQIVRLR